MTSSAARDTTLRSELQIVFDTLFGRVPTLELDIDELPFKDDANSCGRYQLPATW